MWQESLPKRHFLAVIMPKNIPEKHPTTPVLNEFWLVI
jgi:hypothetical protein